MNDGMDVPTLGGLLRRCCQGALVWCGAARAGRAARHGASARGVRRAPGRAASGTPPREERCAHGRRPRRHHQPRNGPLCSVSGRVPTPPAPPWSVGEHNTQPTTPPQSGGGSSAHHTARTSGQRSHRPSRCSGAAAGRAGRPHPARSRGACLWQGRAQAGECRHAGGAPPAITGGPPAGRAARPAAAVAARQRGTPPRGWPAPHAPRTSATGTWGGDRHGLANGWEEREEEREEWEEGREQEEAEGPAATQRNGERRGRRGRRARQRAGKDEPAV